MGINIDTSPVFLCLTEGDDSSRGAANLTGTDRISFTADDIAAELKKSKDIAPKLVHLRLLQMLGQRVSLFCPSSVSSFGVSGESDPIPLFLGNMSSPTSTLNAFQDVLISITGSGKNFPDVASLLGLDATSLETFEGKFESMSMFSPKSPATLNRVTVTAHHYSVLRRRATNRVGLPDSWLHVRLVLVCFSSRKLAQDSNDTISDAEDIAQYLMISIRGLVARTVDWDTLPSEKHLSNAARADAMVGTRADLGLACLMRAGSAVVVVGDQSRQPMPCGVRHSSVDGELSGGLFAGTAKVRAALLSVMPSGQRP